VWKDVSTKAGKGIYLNLLDRIYTKDTSLLSPADFFDKFNNAFKTLVASGTLLAIQSKNVPASDKVNFEKYFQQVFN
jgi:hypothetical protein